jgi:hypothetical protein
LQEFPAAWDKKPFWLVIHLLQAESEGQFTTPSNQNNQGSKHAFYRSFYIRWKQGRNGGSPYFGMGDSPTLAFPAHEEDGKKMGGDIPQKG